MPAATVAEKYLIVMEPTAKNEKVALLSFVAAVLVVLIHVGLNAELGSWRWWIWQMCSNGICRWAVPFFFAVSGYFLTAHIGEKDWWRQAVAKRAKSLMIPYFIWNFIGVGYGIALCIGANMLAHRPLTTNFLEGWHRLQWLGIHPTEGAYVGTLWFVITLFLFVLASPVIEYGVRKLKWGFPLLLLGLSYCGIPPLPFNFNPGWMMYFAAGIAARRYPIKVGRWCAALIPVALAWIAADKWWMLSVGSTVFDSTPRPAIIMLLTGIWAIAPTVRLPKLLGGAAFPLYLMHIFVIQGYAAAFPARTTLLMWIVTWFSTVIICIALAIALRRIAPKLSAVLFGGR